MGVPTLIQEQNSYAGMTNRLLAKKARKICVAYEGMDKYFPAEKLVLAGNPVRDEIRNLLADPGNQEQKTGSPAREAALSEFGIDPGSAVLLILGGSLGAQTINRAVMGGLTKILESGIKVLWQCGRYYYDEIKISLKDIPEGRIMLKDFISRMDLAYRAADVIIARAGAITISELCHAGKPALLVPSPNVAEDHQTKNARALAGKSAAILIPDHEAVNSMIPLALELMKDEKHRKELSMNIKGLAIKDSADRIAREVIGIMKT
jgi:UDP-N-acetylglucosamine--N-acetylmuramyl-(pentapeptide) pyrophosphoryl-undecaprenol N-acetylglucosamine transferase